MIVPFGDAYLPVLAAMHAACFPEEPWDQAALHGLLAQPGLSALIDERGGFLLLRVVLDEAEIISIGTTARRQGIARALLAQGLRQIKDLGVLAAYLEVAVTNAPARALYESFGFEKVGLRRRYYPDGGDAMTMRLALA